MKLKTPTLTEIDIDLSKMTEYAPDIDSTDIYIGKEKFTVAHRMSQARYVGELRLESILKIIYGKEPYKIHPKANTINTLHTLEKQFREKGHPGRPKGKVGEDS